MRSAFGVEHPISKSRKDDVRIVRQHGLTGSPSGVDRNTRKEIWAARDRHLNRKKRKYENISTVATGTENTGKVIGGAAGAAIIGAQIRDSYYKSNPGSRQKAVGSAWKVKNSTIRSGARKLASGSPGWKTLAVAAGASGTAAGAGFIRRRANKKRDKYASVSGGVASGVNNRMRRYDIGKADETPGEHLKRQKRTQAGIAYGTSAMGLGGLAALGGAKAAPKVAPKLVKAGKAPKFLKTPESAEHTARRLEDASTALVTSGAGLGGVGGFNFASIQRQEGKR